MVVASGVAFDDVVRTSNRDSEMRCVRGRALSIARETTTRCDVGRIRVHVGGRAFLLASARGDGSGRPFRSCHPLPPSLPLRGRRSLVLAPSLASSSASSTHAHVSSLGASPTSSFERRNSPLLSVGSERGKTDRFVRVRPRFPSGFVVGSNPIDGPIEPGWEWWRKTPSDHHPSGNTNTRHVREASVDVERNVRNQGRDERRKEEEVGFRGSGHP